MFRSLKDGSHLRKECPSWKNGSHLKNVLQLEKLVTLKKCVTVRNNESQKCDPLKIYHSWENWFTP